MAERRFRFPGDELDLQAELDAQGLGYSLRADVRKPYVRLAERFAEAHLRMWASPEPDHEDDGGGEWGLIGVRLNSTAPARCRRRRRPVGRPLDVSQSMYGRRLRRPPPLWGQTLRRDVELRLFGSFWAMRYSEVGDAEDMLTPALEEEALRRG